MHFSWQVEHRPSISAILTDENSDMMQIEEDNDTVAILDLDPGLQPYKDHFRYRMKRYIEQKKLIENYEGSIENFAQGNDGKSSTLKVILFFVLLQACEAVWNFRQVVYTFKLCGTSSCFLFSGLNIEIKCILMFILH